MHMRLLAMAAAGAVLFGATGMLRAQDDTRSIWSGVYTSDQADRGKAIYLETCAGCHGAGLLGSDEVTPLEGPHFMSDWDTQTVADLVARIHNTMPLDNPGSVSNVNATDLAAFLLQSNDIPAGSVELSENPGFQAQIRISMVNPGEK
jgi:S-disulfanyl-L-cysteine oxidoreductase SoxD